MKLSTWSFMLKEDVVSIPTNQSLTMAVYVEVIVAVPKHGAPRVMTVGAAVARAPKLDIVIVPGTPKADTAIEPVAVELLLKVTEQVVPPDTTGYEPPVT